METRKYLFETKFKQFLNEQKIDYKHIETETDPYKLWTIIDNAIGTFTDDEAVVEAAFIAMDNNKDWGTYRQVNDWFLKNMPSFSFASLRKPTSLLDYVGQNMDIMKIWHKKSIASMARDNGWK